jgi:hypothetical protein
MENISLFYKFTAAENFSLQSLIYNSLTRNPNGSKTYGLIFTHLQ